MAPLRHLSAAEVMTAMPPLDQRINMADQIMRALGHDAELPPKIGVHPRQPGSLAQAMPALLRGDASDGSKDLIGVKWITGFPANPERGLATYRALVLLNDSLTGEPLAVMDGGMITAQRTAAVSGAAIRHFRPRVGGRSAQRVAVLGAGAQARSHLPVIGRLLPGADLRVTDIYLDRAAALAANAIMVDGIGSATALPSVREAVDSADIVISTVSFGPVRQTLDPAWLRPDVLFVAVDYDMQASARLARDAFFVVDERDQFIATRSGPTFAGYPDPDTAIGELLRGAAGPPAGQVLFTHLGVGLADVVFASAILARAELLGLGRLLPG